MGLESSIDDLLAYCRNVPDVQAFIRGEVLPVSSHGSDPSILDYQGSITMLILGHLRLKQPCGFDWGSCEKF